MMEAIDRWWEEKDLGEEEEGSESTWSLLAQAEMGKLRQHSRRNWRSGRSGFQSKLTIHRLCDPQARYLTSLSLTLPSC